MRTPPRPCGGAGAFGPAQGVQRGHCGSGPMIPAQGPDGLRILSQWFFRDWTWPREGDQQQERVLSVAAQPTPPVLYHYS